MDTHSNLSYIRGIDGLRALSILAVLNFHGLTILKPLFGKSGWLGVDIFFVISGFLITRILIRPSTQSLKTRLAHFFYNRSIRILPAFLTVLSVYLLTNPANSLRNDIAVAISACNLADYDIAMKWSNVLSAGLSFCWSLSIEEKFYLILPFILYSPTKNFWKITTLILCCLTWKSLLLEGGADWMRMAAAFDTRYDELLIGCLSALILHSRFFEQTGYKYISALGTLAFVIVFIGFHYIPHPSVLSSQQRITFWCLIMPAFCSCVGIILLSFCNKTNSNLVQNLLNYPIIRHIGTISYSLYLWHGLVFTFGNVSDKNISHQLSLLFIVALIAWLSYILFEKPFQKFKALI